MVHLQKKIIDFVRDSLLEKRNVPVVDMFVLKRVEKFYLIFCSLKTCKPVGLMLLGSSIALNCDFHAGVAEGGSHLCEHLILPSFFLLHFFRFHPVYQDFFKVLTFLSKLTFSAPNLSTSFWW